MYGLRHPATIGEFSGNFCRNPRCRFLGGQPDPFDGRGRNITDLNRGTVSGAGEEQSFICAACGIASTVKSNHALVEEYVRLRTLNRRTNRQNCQAEGCENAGRALSLSPSSYAAVGKTARGDKRFQCKACKQTFSVGSPTRRHKQAHKTAGILKSLANKVPLSRFCEIHDVSLKQIHGKIDFLYQQVLACTNDREPKMAKCFAGQRTPDPAQFTLNKGLRPV